METNGRKINARRIGAFAAFLGLLVSVPPASAARYESSLHSGNVCQATHGGDAALITHNFLGTTNYGASRTISVTCPMIRRTEKSNGAGVFVDVEHEGVQTTTCTLYSVNCSGLVNGQSGPVGPRLLGSTVSSFPSVEDRPRRMKRLSC